MRRQGGKISNVHVSHAGSIVANDLDAITGRTHGRRLNLRNGLAKLMLNYAAKARQTVKVSRVISLSTKPGAEGWP